MTTFSKEEIEDFWATKALEEGWDAAKLAEHGLTKEDVERARRLKGEGFTALREEIDPIFGADDPAPIPSWRGNPVTGEGIVGRFPDYKEATPEQLNGTVFEGADRVLYKRGSLLEDLLGMKEPSDDDDEGDL